MQLGGILGGGGGIVGFTSLVKIEDASYDCPAMVLDHIEDCSLPQAQSLPRPCISGFNACTLALCFYSEH